MIITATTGLLIGLFVFFILAPTEAIMLFCFLFVVGTLTGGLQVQYPNEIAANASVTVTHK
jgi:hypothetical protein